MVFSVHMYVKTRIMRMLSKMPGYLGLDTSNYTTSCAWLSCDGSFHQEKRLLPVKEGEAGLRQSDAVFHHTKQLPELMEKLMSNGSESVRAVGVSAKPRNIDGSYMPCFLCGETLARGIGAVTGARVYATSHQIGHILAALYSAQRLSLLEKPFLAFHVSGGTTDCLLCEPDSRELLKITEMGTSLDLKAGQAVDRTGLMMGLRFPCGKALEELAVQSNRKWKIKPVIKNGSCCLSGLQNQCERLLRDGTSREDTALYCLKAVETAVAAMTECALAKTGDIPVIFAGGVMSNKIIRASLEKRFGGYFAEPEFSCDNAAGTAVYAAIMDGGMAFGNTDNITA